MRAEAARHRPAALLADDEIGGLGKNRQPPVGEVHAGITDRKKRFAERGERSRMHRVAVDHASDVAPCAQHFGVDIDFVVARHRAVDFVAFDVDGDDIVRPHPCRCRCPRASSGSVRDFPAAAPKYARRRNRHGLPSPARARHWRAFRANDRSLPSPFVLRPMARTLHSRRKAKQPRGSGVREGKVQ